MQEIPILRDLVLLLAAAIPVIFLAHKIRLPTVVGFLVTGALIGPFGLALVAESERVATLAEIGVVLLLFAVGLEFNFRDLMRQRRQVLVGGLLQVVATIVLTAAIARAMGAGWPVAVFFGFLLALSSTAVVLKVLQSRAEVDAPHGRLAIGILLFQDLCLVPMLLAIPFLAGDPALRFATLALPLLAALVALVVIVLATRWLLPRLFKVAVATHLREVFTLTVLFTCLGTAWMTWHFGLSLALGAFLAGLVISESDYAHQAVAEILPLRDTFFGLFFIAMGMLFDPGALIRFGWKLPVLLLAIVVGKSLVAGMALWLASGSPRMAITVGLLLAQVGEFSFVLAASGQRAGLLSGASYELFIAVSTISILLAPFLIAVAPQAGFRLARGTPAPEPEAPESETGGAPPRLPSVLVIGYGLNGQNLARVLASTGIPYRILELDSSLCEKGRSQGQPITYGDATRDEVLQAAGVARARVVVVAISDPAATRRVSHATRRLSPEATLIVRTRYVAEIDELYKLGASQVIPEEFETSVEIFARVLRELHVPRNVIQIQVDLIRRERYGMLRGLGLAGAKTEDLANILAASATETFLLLSDSPGIGCSLRDLDLRGKSGATTIAVVRDGKSITNPAPEMELAQGDILLLLGSHAAIDAAIDLLQPDSREGLR